MPESLQKRRSPLARSAFALMMAATATAFWLLLGPVSVGGTFVMASVSGSSMSPTLTDGDLVLLRKHGEYGVGDVAAYTHPDIGLVLHRIVERDAEGFTLRGDNRTAVDSYRPTAEEIVGSRWLRIPVGGRVLQDVLKPRNAALLAIAGMVLSGAAAGATRSRSRPDHGRRDRFRFAALSGYGPVGQSKVDWKSPFSAALEPTLEVLRTTLKARGATDGQVLAATTAQLDAFLESFTETLNDIALDFPPGGGAVSGGYLLILAVDAGCRFVMEAEGELTGGYDAATRRMSGEAKLETTVTVSGGALPNGDPCPQPPPFTGTTTWSATFDPLTLTVGGTVSAVEIPSEFATYAAHNAFDLPFTLDDEEQDAGSSDEASPTITSVTTDPEFLSAGDS